MQICSVEPHLNILIDLILTIIIFYLQHVTIVHA